MNFVNTVASVIKVQGNREVIPLDIVNFKGKVNVQILSNCICGLETGCICTCNS